jgi:hypothetical protein
MQRIPLIVWQKITQPKILGGLGLVDFCTHSSLLKVQHISKILEGHSSEWTVMVSAHIKEALHHGTLKGVHKFWTVREAILLQPRIT